MIDYTIFSIDDSRKHYTDKIRSTLGESFWFKESPVWCVNGSDPNDLYWAQDKHKRYPLNFVGTGNVRIPPRKGQLGIWYSLLNALDANHTPILTFEDDAILAPGFNRLFFDVTSNLPEDTDAFSLFLPRDQDHVYYENFMNLDVTLGICKAYQIYGGVSMYWTRKGAAKFKTLVHLDGIKSQWDNQLYQYAREGKMNVYTQPPDAVTLVSITGSEKSIVQESEDAW